MRKKARYSPLDDEAVERLRDSARPLWRSTKKLEISASTVYALTAELIELRDEVFRLQLCETVDAIIASELDEDEYFLSSYSWSSDPLAGFDEEPDPASGVYKPAQASGDTGRLDRIDPTESSGDSHGRRMSIPTDE